MSGSALGRKSLFRPEVLQRQGGASYLAGVPLLLARSPRGSVLAALLLFALGGAALAFLPWLPLRSSVSGVFAERGPEGAQVVVESGSGVVLGSRVRVSSSERGLRAVGRVVSGAGSSGSLVIECSDAEWARAGEAATVEFNRGHASPWDLLWVKEGS